MLEIEAKFLDVDAKAVEKKLLLLGAEKVFSGKIFTIFFDFPDKRIWESGAVLRLRKKGAVAELTFKKKLSVGKAKVAEETETIVQDFGAMRKILLSLGLVERKSFEKHRVSFALDGAHFELDDFGNVPVFLEIEAKSEKEIEKFATLLGLKMSDAKPWNRTQVLLHYGKK